MSRQGLGDALDILSKQGKNGIAHLLLPDFVDLLANFQAADIAATSAPNERQKSLFVEKFNALWQLRVFAARQLWFSEMTAISGRLISLVVKIKRKTPGRTAEICGRPSILRVPSV